MPVTTTVQNILTWAYGRSTKNKPGTIATESTELLNVVLRAQRRLYSLGARINPTWYGGIAAVNFSSPGWARPAGAELVWRIENLSGGEVVVVPYDQRQAETGMPAVYRYGQIYRTAGNPLDPTSGQLNFFYSQRPTDPTGLSSTLDGLWPEQFNEILVLEVATYLAIKDGRADELPALKAERSAWYMQYGNFLEHETINERKSYGHINRFNSPTVISMLQTYGIDTSTLKAA